MDFMIASTQILTINVPYQRKLCMERQSDTLVYRLRHCFLLLIS